MLILGVGGPIGHGKSTFAQELAALEPATVHFESSQIISEVADRLHKRLSSIPDPYNIDALNVWMRALPAILEDVVHVSCDYDQIKLDENEVATHPVKFQKLIMHVENLRRRPSLAKTKITAVNKETYRPFLQWLGGYLVEKVNSGIWYNEIVRRIHAVDTAGAKLCIVGGLRYPSDAAILRAAGATIIHIYRPGHIQSDMLDPTERERQNIQVDCTVMSNGSIEQLRRTAEMFLEDLAGRKLQKIYKTNAH